MRYYLLNEKYSAHQETGNEPNPQTYVSGDIVPSLSKLDKMFHGKFTEVDKPTYLVDKDEVVEVDETDDSKYGEEVDTNLPPEPVRDDDNTENDKDATAKFVDFIPASIKENIKIVDKGGAWFDVYLSDVKQNKTGLRAKAIPELLEQIAGE